MIDAVYDGLAGCREAGQDQGDRGAQVCGHDRGAGEGWHAADYGGGAVDVDAGAHAVEFGDVHEAVLEDGLGDHRGALRDRHQRHELGLHVGGETWEWLGHDVGAVQAVQAAHRNAALGFSDLHPGALEHAGDYA